MKIIFFDGYCGLCDLSVDFLIQLDKKKEIKFASLQGETAAKILGYTSVPLDPDTVIYSREGQKYERSSAVLKVLGDIGGVWKISLLFFLIPGPLRDMAYKLVAKNRYRIFKRKDSCRIPGPEDRGRILP